MVLPTAVFFWLFEDRCEPEPKRYIFYTFVLGMLMVPLVLPIEQYSQTMFSGIALYIAWAAAEEILKFAAAYFAALRWSVFDEPLDAVMYMATAALGFSAAENALFLIPAIMNGEALKALATGDLRFIGATLLHTLASATVGLMMALSFNKPAATRTLYALLGLILATALHTLFNFFILQESGGGTFLVFLCIWVGIVAVLLLVERIKIPQRDYC
jgi:RsiW-degrading membrane proteinase PrsW (M82 family)